MKRLTCKIIITGILLIVNVSVFAQTYDLTGQSGNFSATGAVYSGPKTIIWNITTGSQKPVKINYDIDDVAIDIVDFYAVDGSNEYLLRTISGNEGIRDSISTVFPTGKAKVQFRIASTNMGNCGYRGLQASYSEDNGANSFVENALVNQDMSVLGKVSIGTAENSSGSRLQVVGNNAYNIYSTNNVTNGFNTYGIYSTNNVTNGYNTFGIYSSAIDNTSYGSIYGLYSYVSGTATNKWAGYFTGGNVQFTNGNLITTNGKVGIGTTTPQNALDVYGSVYLPANNSYWIGSYSDSGNRLRLHHNGTNAYIDYAPNLYFRAGANDAVAFLNNGNVGIGITNPTQKLEVNGAIRAKEVKLETNNWPDFVFKDNYLLKPLQEVNEYIKTNKRLPDIPSEQEVKESGVNLGDMQTKLLQKVEELTLYVINQDKLIQELQKEIKQLKGGEKTTKK